jgi:Zn-finger nucleic acid-binding protein
VVLAGENRCPVCRAALWADDAEAIGTRQCPRCGAELWVLVGAKEPLFFVRQPGQSPYRFLASLTALRYGTPVDQLEAGLKRADRLDLIEWVMDVEDALRAGRFEDIRTGL